MSVDPLNLPRPLPALLSQVKTAAVRKLFVRLAAAGFEDVREGHGCVFGFIDLEHGSRLTELAESANLTKQAVGEAVAELERLGYVERVPDPADGRAKIIRLTDRGRQALAAAYEEFEDIEREFAERFGEREFAQAKAVLEQIAAPEWARRDSA